MSPATLSSNFPPSGSMLASTFEIGGYGADSSVRADLVPVAQAKALAKYGISFGCHSTVLTGDTPRDIEAAQRGGARVIGVASGLFTVDELRLEQPDVVLPSLADADLLVRSILAFADPMLWDM